MKYLKLILEGQYSQYYLFSVYTYKMSREQSPLPLSHLHKKYET